MTTIAEDDENVTAPHDPNTGKDSGGIDCCCFGFGSGSPSVAIQAPFSYGEFGGVKHDATLKELLKTKFLTDIGITCPDNETGLGFLSYLSEDELMVMLDNL